MSSLYTTTGVRTHFQDLSTSLKKWNTKGFSYGYLAKPATKKRLKFSENRQCGVRTGYCDRSINSVDGQVLRSCLILCHMNVIGHESGQVETCFD